MHNKFSTTYTYKPENVEVKLLIFVSFAYAQDMHFGYLNLQNIPCFAYCATSSTNEF